MSGERVYYFGMHPYELEPISLEHSCFGAIWYEEDHHQYIVGYGFGTSQIEALSAFSASSAYSTCKDLQVIHQIYNSIREKQQVQDWSTHKRFPLFSINHEPWRSLKAGWYVLRSRRAFPLHLSIIRKTTFFVWLEHTAVCEDEAELIACINKAKQDHHLHLIKSIDTLGGTTHE